MYTGWEIQNIIYIRTFYVKMYYGALLFRSPISKSKYST